MSKLKLIQTDFLKNAGTLFSGSVIAQLIGFAALTILGRIYTPEEFGSVDTFMKWAGVFAIMAGLRYETAIVVEHDPKNAEELTKLSLLLNAGFSLLILLIVILFKNQIGDIYKLSNPNILYALPLMVGLISGTETLMMWRNRTKEYKHISQTRVLFSLSGTGYKLLHPLTNMVKGHGLFFAQFIAQTLSYLHIAYKLPIRIFSFTKESLKHVAKTHKSFPIFSTPAALLNLLALNMPWLLIPIFDGLSATGHFGNAYKLSYLPMSMLAMALGQVFFERIARLKKDKDAASQMAHELFNIMFTAAVIPVTILAVWGDELAPFIMGDQWKEAGVYIQITIFFYFAMFLTSSFSSAFATYAKLHVQLGYNAVFLIATATALYLGYKYGGSTRVALAWFTVVGTLLRIIILNYFFHLFGKNLVAKTIFAILLTCVLVYLGFSIKEGF